MKIRSLMMTVVLLLVVASASYARRFENVVLYPCTGGHGGILGYCQMSAVDLDDDGVYDMIVMFYCDGTIDSWPGRWAQIPTAPPIWAPASSSHLPDVAGVLTLGTLSFHTSSQGVYTADWDVMSDDVQVCQIHLGMTTMSTECDGGLLE